MESQSAYTAFVFGLRSKLTYIYIYIIFFLRMAGISQTRTISHYNTAESHSHYALALLCGTYQPRLCALALLPKGVHRGGL